MKRYQYFLFFSLLIILFSCDQKRFFEKNSKIQNAIWKIDSIQKFYVNITDTITPYSIYLNVRNSNDYQYSNLFLFVRTISPAQYSIRDTVEFILADKSGKWLGTGLGPVFFNQRLYKENVRFPIPGIYIFEIQQGMRKDELSGITDVGIRIGKF